jgi:hypothetical protein
MHSIQTKEAIDKRNIAMLAKEFALTVAEVSAMYEIQRLHLMEGATVGKYFAIVAVRNIREQLSPTRKGTLQAKRYNTSSVSKGAA